MKCWLNHLFLIKFAEPRLSLWGNQPKLVPNILFYVLISLVYYFIHFRSSTPISALRPKSVAIHAVSPETFGAMLGLCPSKVRLAMLGELGAEKHCVHRTIPFITDVEYDDFIKKFIPSHQMAVVSVISSV